MGMLRYRALALVAALLAVLAIGCGGGDDGGDKPQAEDVLLEVALVQADVVVIDPKRSAER